MEFEERQLLNYSLSLILFLFFSLIAFFTFHLKDVASETWIGLNDINSEDTYLWTDGSIFDYSKWARRFPFRDKYIEVDWKYITIQVNRKKNWKMCNLDNILRVRVTSLTSISARILYFNALKQKATKYFRDQVFKAEPRD